MSSQAIPASGSSTAKPQSSPIPSTPPQELATLDTSASRSPQFTTSATTNSSPAPHSQLHRELSEQADTSKPEQSQDAIATAINADTDDEPRKCWICFSDETEDTPTTSEWRSPCPCALTAHEDCLLDWIASEQNPLSRKRKGTHGKMLCPQCKSEIIVIREPSIVVDIAEIVDRIGRYAVIPTLIIIAGGCIWAGATYHGVKTIYQIFGREDAERILDIRAGTLPGARPRDIVRAWRTIIGLPLIPVALILSRTDVAEPILPALPLLFFATRALDGGAGNIPRWPPDAALSFALLPYVRATYNHLYMNVFARRELHWVASQLPRAGRDEAREGQEGEEQADIQAIAAAAWGGEGQEEEDGVGLDIEVVINDEPDSDHEDVVEPPAAFAGAAPLAQPAQPDAAADQHAEDLPNAENAAPQAIPQAANNPPPNGPINHQHPMVMYSLRYTDLLIGALLFPTVSAGMGTLLNLTLPRSWLAPARQGGKFGGFLSQRWGRSIVGGCLFVVLKDVAVLFATYKQMQTHKNRRVKDFEGSKGKGKGRAKAAS
ncbi:MAG: hypothetical protein M1824_005130 [Vezdaea acicularis]|nr:MAG: hypothetical protein M1824_005130 [Vezdaea acicularis]